MAATLAYIAAAVPGWAVAQTVGQTEQEFADWTVTCPGGSACVAMHSADTARVLTGPGGDGGMRFSVLIASNAGRGTPVALRTPDGTTVQMRTQGCTEAFCKASAAPDVVPELLNRLRDAGGATIAYPAEGRMVFAEVSFNGLTEAVRHAREN